MRNQGSRSCPFFKKNFKEKTIFLTLYTHLYPRSDWQETYSLYFLNIILFNFMFIHGNLSNRYPTDLSWSEYGNEATVKVRILESTEREQPESWPVLAAPGTDQNSESLFYTEVRPLRRACLKGVFNLCLQLPTSLHAHMDQQYYLLFSFPFCCNIIFSLLFTHSFFVCCPF